MIFSVSRYVSAFIHKHIVMFFGLICHLSIIEGQEKLCILTYTIGDRSTDLVRAFIM